MQFLFCISFIFLFIVVRNAHSNLQHYNLTVMQDMEILGELYYRVQLTERTMSTAKDFVSVGANFPCLLGTIPIGSSVITDSSDDHKYLCGLHVISGPPIVYSYGSHINVAFEKSFLRLRPDAKIFVFEVQPDQMPALMDRDPRVTYFPVGLGGYDGKSTANGLKVRTMSDTMKLLNHTYVDVLKMDIEGSEFMFARHELSALGPRIGQFSVEVHVNTLMAKTDYPSENTVSFVESCEKVGLRVFHKEVSRLAAMNDIELSMIQSRWTLFEQGKKQLLPL